MTAAAIGAIVGAVIVLGRRTLWGSGYSPDLVKVGLMVVTLGVLWRFKKVPEPVIVLAAAVAGLLIYPLVH